MDKVYIVTERYPFRDPVPLEVYRYKAHAEERVEELQADAEYVEYRWEEFDLL